MFKCDRCNKQVPPKQRQYKVVSATRHVTYPRREYKFKGNPVLDPGGEGFEIAHESRLCAQCALEVAPEIVEKADAK